MRLAVLDSIRAQTSTALAVGVVAVLVVGVVVAAWTVGRSRSDAVDGIDGALVTLAAAADALPADARTTLAGAARQAGLTVSTGTSGRLEPDAFTDALAQRLRHNLAPLGIRVVAAGHRPPVEGEQPRFLGHMGSVVVRFALSDGTVMEAAEPARWSLAGFLLEALPVIAAVGLGLAVLSVWVARRVTAPLERFAAQAERLGRDVGAPPMDQAGPREIRRAAGVLNQTQQRIQRLLEDRTLMLAAVAHDLRTPIMRLYLRAELLPEEQRSRMERDLHEMEEMVAAALALVREEDGGRSRGPVDLAELLRRVRRKLGELHRTVQLGAGNEVVVEADAGALERAFTNLLDNATRYGGDRATVDWRVVGDRVEVVIDDQGPGIPEADLERAFSPFFRVERSRSRETGGAGLGLTLSRSVVRSHGGDIVLENRPGGGLRQTVTLPRVPG